MVCVVPVAGYFDAGICVLDLDALRGVDERMHEAIKIPRDYAYRKTNPVAFPFTNISVLVSPGWALIVEIIECVY
jgi:hypothetical protein